MLWYIFQVKDTGTFLVVAFHSSHTIIHNSTADEYVSLGQEG